MKRYAIINEPHVEISVNEYKKYGDIINAHIANGMRNGTYDTIEVFDTFEEAKAKLKNYKCSYTLTNGFANVKFYLADFTYIAEQEYDSDYEEWEDTGNYEFAEIEED